MKSRVTFSVCVCIVVVVVVVGRGSGVCVCVGGGTHYLVIKTEFYPLQIYNSKVN